MQFGTIPNADSDQYNQKQEENVKKMCTVVPVITEPSPFIGILPPLLMSLVILVSMISWI